MFPKALAGSLIAGAVAIGALAASTASAAAGYWSYGGGNTYPVTPGYPVYPNYQAGYGYWYFSHPRAYAPVQPALQQVCKPVYKTVQVWKPYYGWVWATVYAGQQCAYQQVYPNYSYGYGW